MSIFGWFGRKRAPEPEARASKISNAEEWISSHSYDSEAGIFVNEDRAETVAAVYSANRIICDSISSIPFILYREVPGGGREEAKDHPLYRLLKYQPNEETDAMEFFWELQRDLNFRGRAYVKLVIDGRGTIQEMHRMDPDRTAERLNSSGRRIYAHTKDNNRTEILRSDQVWRTYLAGGLSPIDSQRENFAIALQHQKHEARFWGNGAKLGIVAIHPGSLSPAASEALKRQIDSKTTGKNAYGTLVLQEGMTVEKVGMTNDQAQFLESIQAKKRDIASIFNVPLHMLQEHSGATFNNIEQKSQDFISYSIRPLAVRWERSLYRSLLTAAEQLEMKAELRLEALLRADFLSRQQGLSIQRQNGIITANEWRTHENMNPTPGGDTRLEPMNMVRIDQQGNEIVPKQEGTGGIPNLPGGKVNDEPVPE